MKSQAPKEVISVEQGGCPEDPFTSGTPSEQSLERTGADRRVHARYACRMNSLCKPVGRHQTGNPWKGWIEDVSKEGLKLTLNRRFEPGALLAVEVDVTKEEVEQVFHCAISRFFLAKVVRVVQRKDGKWTLGCLLVKKFNDDDLESFVEFTGFCHLTEDLESEEPTELSEGPGLREEDQARGEGEEHKSSKGESLK